MGSVQATIDWRTATPEELDGHRCIITTVDAFNTALGLGPAANEDRHYSVDTRI